MVSPEAEKKFKTIVVSLFVDRCTSLSGGASVNSSSGNRSSHLYPRLRIRYAGKLKLSRFQLEIYSYLRQAFLDYCKNSRMKNCKGELKVSAFFYLPAASGMVL